MILGVVEFKIGAALAGAAMGVACGSVPFGAARKQDMPITGALCLGLCGIIGLAGGLLFALPSALALLVWVKISQKDWLGFSGIFFGLAAVFAAAYYFTPQMITPAEPQAQAMESRTLTSSDGRTIEARVLSVDETTAEIEREDGKVYQIPLEKFSEADQDLLLSFGSSESGQSLASRTDLWKSLADGDAYFTFFGLIPLDLYEETSEQAE